MIMIFKEYMVTRQAIVNCAKKQYKAIALGNIREVLLSSLNLVKIRICQ